MNDWMEKLRISWNFQRLLNILFAIVGLNDFQGVMGVDFLACYWGASQKSS